ncbi:hypothetical protein CYMTET_20427 [Cymbomonas tetramitiformis]|uniref:C2H2-type domain-containing protein n=1 Tax=Cymbomonas tetramitiformis TaxID=36881 RepID=A0AAE0G436_9CHLO|nr:hypothetical protein CYMTET_20427 [Cymbomonas tetramitiformis]
MRGDISPEVAVITRSAQRVANQARGILLHKCSECGRGFSSSTALARHEYEHTSAKPFACPECTKRFEHLPALMKHKAKTHRESGGMEYSCSKCHKRFSTAANLVRHKIMHQQREQQDAEERLGAARKQASPQKKKTKSSKTSSTLKLNSDSPGGKHLFRKVRKVRLLVSGSTFDSRDSPQEHRYEKQTPRDSTNTNTEQAEKFPSRTHQSEIKQIDSKRWLHIPGECIASKVESEDNRDGHIAIQKPVVSRISSQEWLKVPNDTSKQAFVDSEPSSTDTLQPFQADLRGKQTRTSDATEEPAPLRALGSKQRTPLPVEDIRLPKKLDVHAGFAYFGDAMIDGWEAQPTDCFDLSDIAGYVADNTCCTALSPTARCDFPANFNVQQTSRIATPEASPHHGTLQAT